jgi:dipeptidyl aminopeptidase/acylaminoacyl peptidase
MPHHQFFRAFFVLVLTELCLPSGGVAQEKRAMTLRDVMQFKSIRTPAISDDGRIVAFEVRPDRGDGEVWVRVVATGKTVKVPRGTAPKITTDGRFVLATVTAPFGSKGKNKPKNALAIVNVKTGSVTTIAKVERAIASKNGRFAAWTHFAKKPDARKPDAEKKKTKGKRKVGHSLVLRDLNTTKDVTVSFVTALAFSPDSKKLTYVVCTPDGKGNGLFHRDLQSGSVDRTPLPNAVVGRFAWSESAPRVAFTSAKQDDDGELGDATLRIDDVTSRGKGGRLKYPAITSKHLGRGYVLCNDTDIRWSKDGKRLLFSARGKAMEDLVAANAKLEKAKKDKTKKPENPFDYTAILKDREVDVWHYRDPLVNSNQKKSWAAHSKRSFRCVFDLASQSIHRLADSLVSSVTLQEGSNFALGRATKPYLRQITWDGRYADYYQIDVTTGKRKRVLFHHSGSVSQSPSGRYILWFDRGHWWLRDDKDGRRRNVTRGLKVPFANEDHDYPRAVPGYGIGGWYSDESHVLIYDKFDIWLLSPHDVKMTCLTASQGRKNRRQLRVVDLDPETNSIDQDDPLLLTGFNEEDKGWSLWEADPLIPGVNKLLDTDDRIRVIAKAKNADRILYTREDYDRFPDLHVADLEFKNSEQVTTFDSQRKPFHWGTAELIDWRSIDGKRIQGAVIKPGNYDPTKRYPVLVYYYRFFSQRVNEWNQVVVNHRPCFPFWASNGYVVFLPDIRFDIGRPGYAATKSLIPGVQKLIDLGIADPKAIALHGHSWSGYQTAFVITQSDIFACALAGAPVSNMTSAYGGIRWGTGLSRQFQYEKTQSRIGGSLWEYPERYIENSPLFFADRIKTPLLIQFGDEDGAVPWYQGIELYMAMRRLDKPCVFLQYRGEPHHLKKYANKLDYSMKFKEYVDHYCLGTKAPKWIRQGVPYQGR